MTDELTKLESQLEAVKQNIRNQTAPVPLLLSEARNLACRIVKLRED